MALDLPQIGYGDEIAAVVTVEMAHLRLLPTVHREPQPDPGSLAARGFKPLPKLTPEQRQYAEALAAAAAANPASMATPI